MEHYRNPHAATPGFLIREVGLLILRLASGLVLGLHHAHQQVLLGWAYIWKKEPWPLEEVLAGYGLPLAAALAIACTVIVVLGSLGLVFGLLSRVSALGLLACALVGVAFNAGQPPGEKLFLYAAVFLVLFLCGPGCFSLDYLLNRRRGRA